MSKPAVDMFDMFFRSHVYVDEAYARFNAKAEYENELIERLTISSMRSQLLTSESDEDFEHAWAAFIENRRELLTQIGAVVAKGEKSPETDALKDFAKDIANYDDDLFDGAPAKRVVDRNDPWKTRFEPVDPDIITDVNFVLVGALQTLSSRKT